MSSTAALLPRLSGPELREASREFTSIRDPMHRMNPSKVVNPYPPDRFPRLGPGDHADDPATVFRPPAVGGSLESATGREMSAFAPQLFRQYHSALSEDDRR